MTLVYELAYAKEAEEEERRRKKENYFFECCFLDFYKADMKSEARFVLRRLGLRLTLQWFELEKVKAAGYSAYDYLSKHIKFQF